MTYLKKHSAGNTCRDTLKPKCLREKKKRIFLLRSCFFCDVVLLGQSENRSLGRSAPLNAGGGPRKSLHLGSWDKTNSGGISELRRKGLSFGNSYQKNFPGSSKWRFAALRLVHSQDIREIRGPNAFKIRFKCTCHETALSATRQICTWSPIFFV